MECDDSPAPETSEKPATKQVIKPTTPDKPPVPKLPVLKPPVPKSPVPKPPVSKPPVPKSYVSKPPVPKLPVSTPPVPTEVCEASSSPKPKSNDTPKTQSKPKRRKQHPKRSSGADLTRKSGSGASSPGGAAGHSKVTEASGPSVAEETEPVDNLPPLEDLDFTLTEDELSTFSSQVSV